MRDFTLQLSTKVHFGTHIVREALEQEKRWFAGKVLIVTTGRSLATHGHLDELRQILEGIAGKGNVVIYDQVSPNPRLEEVKRAVMLGRQHGVKTVIGFGGGSALDAAKAAAVGIPAKEDLEEYLLAGKEPSGETLPIIAIPTTAGTGSELSKAAIISSPQHHIKAGIRGKYVLPSVAIVDAAYTWTMPKKITMETGFDVLAHAIESYVAVKANLFSEMLSEKAIRLVGENLTLLSRNPEDHEAREKMCYASMIMGINLANVGTCLPHRMQYAIGAATDTSHAAGLIALYPAWLMHEYSVNEGKIRQIMTLLRGSEARTGTPERVRNNFADFLEQISVGRSLTDLGIRVEMLKELTGQVTGNLANDPLATEAGIVEQIFKDAMNEV